MPTYHTNKEIQANRRKYARKRGLRPGTRAWDKYTHSGSRQFAHGKAGAGNKYAKKGRRR